MDFKDTSGKLPEKDRKEGKKSPKRDKKTSGKSQGGRGGGKKEREAVKLSRDATLGMEEFDKKIPANKNAKDSVFLDLFGQKEYLLQLYRVMHPEDKTTTEDDLRYITINRVLLRGIYNDLGFMAGDRLMVLVEAQSTWTMNIIPRILIYLAHSLQSYFKAADANIYSATQIYIPRLELYVLFTCDEAKGRDIISLSDEFFGGKECDVDVRVHILYRDVKEQPKDADIVWEYAAFTKVFDRCVGQLGRTAEAASRVLEICKDRKILERYFKLREEEVRRTMLAIFEQEEAEAIDRRNFRKEITAEVTAKVTEEVTTKVTEEVTTKVTEEVTTKVTEANKEEIKKCVIKMAKAGEISVKNLSVFFPQLSADDIEEIKKEAGV